MQVTGVVPRVVVTNRIHSDVLAYLETFCRPVVNWGVEPLSRENLLSVSKDADGMLVFMNDWIDDAFLAYCPSLQIISAALKGYDNFDIEACARKGVCFAYVPDRLTVATAELAMGLMIGLGRKLIEGDSHVRSGKFFGWRPFLYGNGLAMQTVGILGMGNVGRALARRLAACEMRVLYHDQYRLGPGEEASLGVSFCGFDDVVSQSDYLVPLLPLSRNTYHLIDEDVIARMLPHALLINPSRGSIIDENAVARALQADRLAGYAADVFEMEDWAVPDRPLKIPDSLLELREKTLFTPHLGSAVRSVRLAIEMEAASHLDQFFSGGVPRHRVEPSQTSEVR